MADVQPLSASNGAEPDELDALFDFIPRPNETTDQYATHTAVAPGEQLSNDVIRNPPPARLTNDDYLPDADALGIDDEVKVRKRRAPQPKLDEDRILSANGIPKLQRIAKDRFRFRGKGHEFSDVARLLMTYQLWLDGLYPKAKFLDGLAMIEKLGHKKRLQVMRRAWIDGSKTAHHSSDDSESDDVDAERIIGGEEGIPLEGGLGLFEEVPEMQDRSLYSATPRPANTTASGVARTGEAGEPDEDELDALLAEERAVQPSTTALQPSSAKGAQSQPEDDEFADEMEAMAEMGGTW